MKKRVVILGDSLAMPRPNDDVTLEDTYPYLLSLEGYEVFNRARRANDTTVQSSRQHLLDDIEFLKPDAVILHLGIVDCAPRIFSRREHFVVNMLPGIIQKPLLSLISRQRYRITKIRKLTYVDINKFRINLEKILTYTPKNTIIIKILNTNMHNKRRSFDFENNIIAYNKVLDDLSTQYDLKSIDLNGLNEKTLLPDGIHITKYAHETIAATILKTIN